MCGVPIVTNPAFSKNEVYECGEAVFSWEWEKKKDEEDNEKVVKNVSKAAEQMIAAFDKAMAEANREEIRRSAVARFGKKAFVERTELKSLLS